MVVQWACRSFSYSLNWMEQWRDLFTLPLSHHNTYGLGVKWGVTWCGCWRQCNPAICSGATQCVASTLHLITDYSITRNRLVRHWSRLWVRGHAIVLTTLQVCDDDIALLLMMSGASTPPACTHLASKRLHLPERCASVFLPFGHTETVILKPNNTKDP